MFYGKEFDGESEIQYRPIFGAVVVDDRNVHHPEQAYGVIDDGCTHFSVTDIDHVLENLRIDPRLVVDRAIDKSHGSRSHGFVVPRGKFELNEGLEKPVISVLVSNDNRYELQAAQVNIEKTFSGFTDITDPFNNYHAQTIAKVEKMAARLAKLFQGDKCKEIYLPPLSSVSESQLSSRMNIIASRLSIYTGVLMGQYFEENNIPGLYSIQEKNQPTLYSSKPGFHESLSVHGLLSWSSPGRKPWSLANLLQASWVLKGKGVLYSKQQIDAIASRLNSKATICYNTGDENHNF